MLEMGEGQMRVAATPLELGQLPEEEVAAALSAQVRWGRALAEEDQMALVEQQQTLLGHLPELTPSMETSGVLV
jgi:hypothetical protein